MYTVYIEQLHPSMFIGVQRSGKTTIANIAKRLVGANNYAGLGLEGFAQDGTLESALDKTVLWVGDAVRTATRGKTTKGPTMIEGIQLQGFRGISLKPDEQPENVSAFPQQGVC